MACQLLRWDDALRVHVLVQDFEAAVDAKGTGKESDTSDFAAVLSSGSIVILFPTGAQGNGTTPRADFRGSECGAFVGACQLPCKNVSPEHRDNAFWAYPLHLRVLCASYQLYTISIAYH